jgi:hypothetical protein
VAKEFTLSEFCGDRSAVDRDESLPRPWAKVVDSPSENFFSGTRFSLDKHRGVAGRDPRELAKLGTKNGTFSDDLLETNTRLDLVHL